MYAAGGGLDKSLWSEAGGAHTIQTDAPVLPPVPHPFPLVRCGCFLSLVVGGVARAPAAVIETPPSPPPPPATFPLGAALMSAANSVVGRRPARVVASPQQPLVPVPRSLGMATAPCGDCAGGLPRRGSSVAAELVPAAPTAACAVGGRRRGCGGGGSRSSAASGNSGRPPCADAAVAVGGGRPPRSRAPAVGALQRLSLPRKSVTGGVAAREPPPTSARRRARSSTTGAFDLPRLAIPDVATAVAEHLNKPPRLRAVLRRLAAANAASHTSALAVWASEEEEVDGVGTYVPSAQPPNAPPAYGRDGVPAAAFVPQVLHATTRGPDGGLPAAVLPARIVWRDDVRVTVEAAAAAGRGQAGSDEAASGGGCRGVVMHAASTAWVAIVGGSWEGEGGGKATQAEDGSSWWLLLRAVLLVALALVWMVAL